MLRVLVVFSALMLVVSLASFDGEGIEGATRRRRRSSRRRRGATKKLAKCRDDSKELTVKLNAKQDERQTPASSPAVKAAGSQPAESYKPSWWGSSKCGLSEERINELEYGGRLPNGQRAPSCRRGWLRRELVGSTSAKNAIAATMSVVFHAFELTADILGVAGSLLPSKTCCNLLTKATTQGKTKNVWRPEVVQQCCGLTPDSECKYSPPKATATSTVASRRLMGSGGSSSIKKKVLSARKKVTKAKKTVKKAASNGGGTCLELMDAEKDYTRIKGQKKCGPREHGRLKPESPLGVWLAKAPLGKSLGESHQFLMSTIKSVASKVGGAIKGKLLDMVLNAVIPLLPSKFQPIVRKLVPKLLKGDFEGAFQEALPQIVPVILPMFDKGGLKRYQPILKLVLPSVVQGDIQGALGALMPRFKSVVLDKIVYPMFKFPTVVFECILRAYLLPVADSEYRIMVEPANVAGYFNTLSIEKGSRDPLAIKGKRLEGPDCGLEADDGPIHLRVRRIHRKQKKSVCQFDFYGDLHSCYDAKCGNDVWFWPRTTSTNYTKELNDDSHNCRPWFMASNAVLQSVFGLSATLRSVNVLGGAAGNSGMNCFGP